jgi:hypothetical protein
MVSFSEKAPQISHFFSMGSVQLAATRQASFFPTSVLPRIRISICQADGTISAIRVGHMRGKETSVRAYVTGAYATTS